MLPGLEPYSSYKLNVRVVNGKGEGPASPDKVFKTPEGGMKWETQELSQMWCIQNEYTKDAIAEFASWTS